MAARRKSAKSKPAKKRAKPATTKAKKAFARKAPLKKAPPKGTDAESLLIDVLRASPVGAVISRPDGNILYANDAIGAFFGIRAESAVGGRTTSFFADPAQRDAHIAALQKHGHVHRVEMLMRTAARADRVALISARTMRFRGAPAILSWVEDETEQRHKQEVLLATSKQMELVHDISGIANRAVNFYDALRQGVAEIAGFLGWPIRLVYRLAHGRQDLLEIATFSFAPDVPAQPLKAALLGNTFAKHDDLPGRVLAEGETVWIESVAEDSSLTRFVGEAGKLIGTALAVPVLADGKVVAVLEFLHTQKIAPDDLLVLTLSRVGAELGRVHMRDQTTVALQEARAEAESSSRAKASFLAAMSHEVRTPMNGVVGMVDLLMQTRLDDEQRIMLMTVKESGQALIKVINDILDFSKIDAGRLEIEAAEFSILKVVEDVTAALAPIAMEKALRVVAYVDPLLPEGAIGDAVRVRQILSNLGGNAVKFSHAGEIVIRADRLDDAKDGRVKVRFSVKDQGIGISAEAQRRLFEEFSQADTSTTRKFGGTGLGLAISHRLTTLMDGEIGVKSELGRGTEFFCILPLAVKSEAPATSPQDLAGLNVLVVSASNALREACRAYLGHWNVAVTAVEQMRDCLPVFQNMRTQGRAVDIIVIPELEDGAQLAVLTRAFADKGLTPYPRFVVGRDLRRAGMESVRVKEVTYMDVNPLRRASLITAVAIAAGRASPEPYELAVPSAISNFIAPSVTEALAENQLILIAEDHEANREVLRRQLNRLGYACEIANDGVAALALWRSKTYALLLSDCHMPEMDGFSLTAAIREAEEGTDRHTPIVAVTANVLQGEAERCLAAGMDDFLPKPAEMVTLKATLEKWIGPPRAARPAPPVVATRANPTETVLDLTIMSQTFGEINDEARDMFKLFVESIRPLIGKFEGEVEKGQLEAACETIHKARGAAANAGGKELAAVMGRIEAALVAQNMDDVTRECAGLQPAWTRLQDAIAAA